MKTKLFRALCVTLIIVVTIVDVTPAGYQCVADLDGSQGYSNPIDG
jgi:hypothetical protein